MPSQRLKTTSARRTLVSQLKSLGARTGTSAGLVAAVSERGLDFLDAVHDGRHVLGVPGLPAAIVQDRNLHAAASASRDRPLIRRQAMSATVRISSS